MVKASAYNAGDLGSIPGSGRSSGEGNGNHSSILARKIPWMEKPGRLQSMGSQRVGHDWVTSLSFTFLWIYAQEWDCRITYWALFLGFEGTFMLFSIVATPIYIPTNSVWGFPRGSVVKSCLQCRRCRRPGFGPWAGKIPRRKAWQPTPVFLSGESHGQSSLAGYRVT